MLEAHLFGRFQLHRYGQPIPGSSQQRVRELLAYLLLHPGQAHERESLTDRLWGTAERPQRMLSQTLWLLRTWLPESHVFLHIEKQWICLEESDLLSDVSEFRRIFREQEGLSGDQLSDTQIQELQRASAMGRQALLLGWTPDWCLWERERLQDLALLALEKLMDYCLKTCQYDAGLAYGAELLLLDSSRESTHVRMMRLHAAGGNIPGALRQYQRCHDTLQTEFGVAPGAALRALHSELSNTSGQLPRLLGEELQTVNELLYQVQSLLNNVHRILSTSPVEARTVSE